MLRFDEQYFPQSDEQPEVGDQMEIIKSNENSSPFYILDPKVTKESDL